MSHNFSLTYSILSNNSSHITLPFLKFYSITTDRFTLPPEVELPLSRNQPASLMTTLNLISTILTEAVAVPNAVPNLIPFSNDLTQFLITKINLII